MEPNLAEFIIVQTVRSEDNFLPGPYCVLVGRCGDVPIPKGEVFRAVYRYRTDHYPDEMGNEPIRNAEHPVRLEVVEIQTHNRSLDELGQGMTGALFVRGDGLDRLAPGWVIGQPILQRVRDRLSQAAPEPATVAKRH